MAEKIELTRTQVRTLLLYEYRLGHDAAAAQRNICHTMGESSVSYNTAKSWFNKFKNNDFELEEKPHTGRLVEVEIDRLMELIDQDPRLSSRELGEELGCSHMTIQRHLHEAGKQWKYGAWVPHDLSLSQLQVRVDACMSLLTFRRNFNWLRQLVTGDDKWVLYVNHSRKRQWLSPGDTGIATPKPGQHDKKVMLSVWWTVKGVVHWELLPPGSTVNADTYCLQLDRLAEKLKKEMDRIYFLHDNARPHIAKISRKKLQELGWTVMPHPAYSPDLAPSDYHLFR